MVAVKRTRESPGANPAREGETKVTGRGHLLPAELLAQIADCESKCSEEGKERVIRPIPGRLTIRRRGLREHSLLQLKVGLQVNLCRLDRLVPEPERDDRLLDASLQQVHRRCVPKHVRRNGFALQCGAAHTECTTS